MATVHERVHLQRKLGNDVITEGRLGSLGGNSIKSLIECSDQGVQAAMWSLNPWFSFADENGVCFAPFKQWGFPNVLGICHLSGLVLVAIPALFWCGKLLGQGVLLWTDPRYLVFTWHLETSRLYSLVAHTALGLALVLAVYGTVHVSLAEGTQWCTEFLKFAWAELVAMFWAAITLERAWAPPFEWQDPAFLTCQLVRSWKHFGEANDDYGRRLTDALVRAVDGQSEEIAGFVQNTGEWRRLLRREKSTDEVFEQKDGYQALLPDEENGEQALPCKPQLPTPPGTPRESPRRMLRTMLWSGSPQENPRELTISPSKEASPKHTVTLKPVEAKRVESVEKHMQKFEGITRVTL